MLNRQTAVEQKEDRVKWVVETMQNENYKDQTDEEKIWFLEKMNSRLMEVCAELEEERSELEKQLKRKE